jgi:hypothetical protein
MRLGKSAIEMHITNWRDCRCGLLRGHNCAVSNPSSPHQEALPEASVLVMRILRASRQVAAELPCALLESTSEVIAVEVRFRDGS